LATDNAEIGVIGGTGVYDPGMLEEARAVRVYTPYGDTSDSVTLGRYKNRTVAFIPRHGRGHTIPPHRLNFRANIWALKALGVTRILSASAVGSLREDYKPGDFVIIDQFIDRTRKRADTFYDGGRVCHISSADPFCPELRRIAVDSAKRLGFPVHEAGTYVCIEGPRFSTRAESKLFRSWGADVIGMTVYPECVLAREQEICYVSIATVTDYDVWAEKPVSAEDIRKTLRQNVDRVKRLIAEVVSRVPAKRSCGCGEALSEALL